MSCASDGRCPITAEQEQFAGQWTGAWKSIQLQTGVTGRDVSALREDSFSPHILQERPICLRFLRRISKSCQISATLLRR
jgi:hypothetical protein